MTGLRSLLAEDRRWMKLALRQAEQAFDEGEVPVGAVVVRDGLLLGRGHNQVERLKDPTAHAEMIALSAACETAGSKFIEGATLYVTLEPCPMCAGAIVWARPSRLVFGAADEKAGACQTLYSITEDPRLNHRVATVAGVEEEASRELLQAFFRRRRMRGESPPPRGGDGWSAETGR